MPFQADKGSSRAGKDPPVPAEAPLRPTEGPARSKDLPRKLTAEHLSLAHGSLKGWGRTRMHWGCPF